MTLHRHPHVETKDEDAMVAALAARGGSAAAPPPPPLGNHRAGGEIVGSRRCDSVTNIIIVACAGHRWILAR